MKRLVYLRTLSEYVRVQLFEDDENDHSLACIIIPLQTRGVSDTVYPDISKIKKHDLERLLSQLGTSSVYIQNIVIEKLKTFVHPNIQEVLRTIGYRISTNYQITPVAQNSDLIIDLVYYPDSHESYLYFVNKNNDFVDYTTHFIPSQEKPNIDLLINSLGHFTKANDKILFEKINTHVYPPIKLSQVK